MWNNLRRVVEPELPLPLEVVKLHLREDSSEPDYEIDAMIRAAAAVIEGPEGAGLALNSQQYTLSLPLFPYEIELPIHPVVSVDSITYVDPDGATQTVATSLYEVDLIRGRVRPVQDQSSWPSTDTVYNAVVVTFTAGFDPLPQDLEQALKLIVGHWYIHRETAGETTDKPMREIPMGAESIIARYRRW